MLNFLLSIESAIESNAMDDSADLSHTNGRNDPEMRRGFPQVKLNSLGNHHGDSVPRDQMKSSIIRRSCRIVVVIIARFGATHDEWESCSHTNPGAQDLVGFQQDDPGG